MICISLSPPYGTLIALLLKRIETRGWATSHRGPLGIHQTAAPGPSRTTEAALWDLCLSDPFRAPLLAAGYGNPARLPRGKIVAVVELVDCLPTAGPRVNGGGPKYADWVHELSGQERAFGDYTPGRYGWKLDNVRVLETPIPAHGMPGLWRYDGELLKPEGE